MDRHRAHRERCGREQTARSMFKHLGGFVLALLLLCGTLSPSTARPPQAHADTIPDIGARASGTCYIENTWMIGSQSYFIVSNFTGDLAGAQPVSPLECLDHTAAEPTNTPATFEATVTAVNVQEGWVEYFVRITPPGVTDGHTIVNGALAGYQHVGGTVRVKREFVGGIELQKRSANTTLSDNNTCYSLQGATYGVYRDKACTALATTITTNADGRAQTGLVLVAGTYYVKETAAPAGYALDETVYPVVVAAGQTASVETTDMPQSNPLDLIVDKVDAETSLDLPLGSASLEGAEYTLRFFGGHYSTVEAAEASGEALRTWILKTDANGHVALNEAHKVSGDDFYTDAEGRNVLPLGTVLVQETKAPEGYLLDDTVQVVPITGEGTAASVNTYHKPTHAEHVKRGDFEFVKADGATMERLARVPFLVTSTTTGEQHVIVTDENGFVSTAADWNPHSAHTNASDAALIAPPSNNSSAQEHPYKVDEALLDPAAGVWFGRTTEGDEAPVDDSLGALPYDHYTVEELPCTATSGYELVRFELTISRNEHTIDLGTVDNEPHPPIILDTTATSLEGGKEVDGGEETKTRDTVQYDGARVGETYTLKGQLICATETTQEDYDAGAYSPLAQSEATFIADKTTGEQQLSFTVDTSNHAGHDIVTVEKLYRVNDDGSLPDDPVATHEDLTYEGQTVQVTEPPAPAEPPAKPAQPVATKTGDTLAHFWWVPLVLAGAAAGIILALRFGRKVTSTLHKQRR